MGDMAAYVGQASEEGMECGGKDTLKSDRSCNQVGVTVWPRKPARAAPRAPPLGSSARLPPAPLPAKWAACRSTA